MPEPADKNARATAKNAGQPQTRRRRDLRRPAGASPDARTGTMPAAATPNNSRTAPTRRSSWAEAAAVADAQAEVAQTEVGAAPEAPDAVPSPVPASVPALPASQPAASQPAPPGGLFPRNPARRRRPPPSRTLPLPPRSVGPRGRPRNWRRRTRPSPTSSPRPVPLSANRSRAPAAASAARSSR